MANYELRAMVAQAYPRGRRVRDAFRFINAMAEQGCAALERTKAAMVAATYGIEVSLVKRMKAKRRNELSFNDGGK